jgi:hypothetical protein
LVPVERAKHLGAWLGESAWEFKENDAVRYTMVSL